MLGTIFVSFLFLFVFAGHARADFDPNNIISDGGFVNINAMSTSDIQSFLQAKGSFLKDFSENGRSAAQIIFDASHGYGDASGSINGITIDTGTGTINPQVILVTLQKEQSLVSRTSSNDNALRAAMGYGCPDGGGCNSNYAGFTKQVEWASWQLRYNYERASGHGFNDYQVGQTMHIYNTYPNPYGGPSEQDITFANRSTASLYRYTPHAYNGNRNFWYFFNQWFVLRDYYASYVSQSIYPTMTPGSSTTMEIKFRNTGTETWYPNGNHPVILGLDKSWAASTIWQGSGWISQNRLTVAQEGNVAPGDVGTYRFNISAPSGVSIGNHRFYVRLVAENLTWFENPDTNGAAWWGINIPTPSAQYISQSGYVTAWPGDTVPMSVTFRNITGTSWSKTSPPTNLAIDSFGDQNFLSKFQDSTWLSSNRIASLPQDQIANGENATYNFNIKIPSDLGPGSYRFFVRLVQDGYSWFNNPDTNGGAWWQITIPRPSAKWISQSVYPTVQRGQIANMLVTFKNTSGVTWRNSGAASVNLATDHFQDENAFKRFKDSSWIGDYRISGLPVSQVANGDQVTYSFGIKVPEDMSSGTYRFAVRMVAEGFAWFDYPDTNGAAWWQITVQ